ncbi:MAG: Gfo/Idh/MocA family oxidoreductase [Candidatus Omnitrophota bacterium]
MKTNGELKVGIAGYGVVGKRRRQFIDGHPRLKTVAVCDQNFEVSGVMPDDVKFFPDYKQLLKEPIDIVFVCLPNYIAAEVTIEGLKSGMHVFCEKPPGRNVEDIKKVISVEKENPKVVLKYGFNHRYHKSVREALAIVKSGKLGKIINLRGVYGKSKVMSFAGGWRAERKFSGGGILLDQGIHMVDLMKLFCGDFKEVKSYVSNDYWKHDVEDNAFVLMKDKKGRVATLHSSATQWQHRFSLDINLTKGFLELQGILSGSKSYGEEKLVVVKKSESDFGSMQEETITYLEDNSWKDEIYEFVDAIIKGDRIEDGTSQEALDVMKIIYRIYYADPEWRKKYNISDPDKN